MGSRLLFALLAAAALAGCDAPQRYGAAQDVHAFLTAVQTDDRAAFDSHIDRPALRADLRRRLGNTVSGGNGDILGAILSSSTGDRMMDQAITPEGFRLVWKTSGAPTDHVPAPYVLAFLLRMDADDQACLHDVKRPDRCLMTFKDEGGTWKLTGVPAAGDMARG